MTLDYYERHLLAMAVEASDYTQVEKPYGGWLASWFKDENSDYSTASAPTLADALTALLRDLGIEPPERPSAEAVEAWAGECLTIQGFRDMDLLARDPLLAAAVLEAPDA